MKKIISLFLAMIMIAAVASAAVSAEILYEDDFEDGKNEEFWDGTGKFEFEDGTMNGFDDAKIGQSRYNWSDYYGAGVSTTDEWPCQKEFTEWIDVKVDESGITENFCSGFWIQDGYDAFRGYASDRVIYSVLYYALASEELVDVTVTDDAGNETVEKRSHTSFVRMFSNTERKEKDYPEHIYGTLDIEGDPYFNIGGDPVKIGVRFGRGNITAYANGKIVGSYDYESIGMLYTPILVQNEGCYVEFDNYGLGTYDHDVKEMTRPDDYALYEGKVIVMDGENVAGEIKAAEDDALSIEAPKVSGRKFVKWESVIVGDFEINAENAGKVVWTNNLNHVEDFANEVTKTYKEKAELLYGIEIGGFEDKKFSITMPDFDIVLKAVYEDGEDEPPAGEVVPGDANGDGKLNAKDVTAIMKYLVNAAPAKFDEKAADYDGSGTINAKDVTKLMKYLVTH